MKKINWRILPPLALAVVAGFVAMQTVSEPKEGSSQGSVSAIPCPAETTALLGGLEVGRDLGVYTVTSMRCTQPHVIDIELVRDKTTRIGLTVAAKGAMPHRAPKQTSKHDLFYSSRSPHSEGPSDGEISELLTLLAELVEAAEQREGAPKSP